MTKALRTPLADPVFMTVNGTRLIADPSGVAYWPDESVLLVSDLHFEKGSAYAARGQLLPPYDTRATLQRLAAAITVYQPESVIALGDSFHDLGADGRMAPDDAEALSALVASVQDWLWIEGNHDPKPPVSGQGRRVRRRCFATDGARLILPAFGAYTGGLNVCDAAYAPLFQTRPHAYMLGRERVYAVNGAKLLGD
ncbi:ligase-associated DNA damage response endonuclease PdeM [Oceanicaulis alexandrii]|uniref:ligase-associated DNA damage response endonuclease PdeM n=1 Tax=Oceanicaulis alexandrii TaxID=153233 RepID=UPI002354609F|nr:ligase-associated DNA damage response endonuclease PdeM [Oceanicaulis alexandrii]